MVSHKLLCFLLDMEDTERFDSMKPSLTYLYTEILAHIRYIAKFCPGYVHFGRDRDILSALGVSWQLGKAPQILILSWHPPPEGWIKANSDGLAKGNPGPAACGGVFRNARWEFLGGFGLALGHHTAFYSEIMAVIFAAELTYAGWFNL